MLVVGDVLVSDDVVDQKFVCNLAACKGACCWEGEYGAPLEPAELNTLAEIYPVIAKRLTPRGRAAIEEQGVYVETEDGNGPATPLIDGGPCAYLTKDKSGITLCGIEQAYRAGEIDWRKPISCHLYPIRVKYNEAVGFQALNYDQWDICSAACTKGAQENISIYEFAKDALIRKYGAEWYDELVAAVTHREEHTK